ncbi:MAG: hypothetical protein HY267_04810 [Deltaproteobacteria bacterium]|nr:hypothetical protein [Deltaproteobacteria bacterium]
MSINAVHVTAARWRIGMNAKGLVWAAARDGRRWASPYPAVVYPTNVM